MTGSRQTMTNVWGLYERLMQQTEIDPISGCWIWIGSRIPKGYGYLRVDGITHVYIHRISWQMYFGPIPVGKHICHRCDNPPCWNPAHLWTGTNLENHRDAVRKGRQPNGERVWHLAKLTEAQVLAIRADRRAGMTFEDIALKHGATPGNVEAIVYRVSWKHLP